MGTRLRASELERQREEARQSDAYRRSVETLKRRQEME